MEQTSQNQEVENQNPENNEEVIAGQEVEGDVILPSEQEEFKIPEKYEGKSAEEVYKLMLKEQEYKASKENKDVKADENNGNENSDEKSENVLQYIYKEFSEKGELSEDNIKVLEEKGISKEDMEIYSEGLKAKQLKEAQEQADAMLSEIGSSFIEVQELNNWLLSNKTEQEIALYNEALAGADGNNSATKYIIQNALNEYRQMNPSKDMQEFNVHANGNQRQGVQVYETRSDFDKDFRDKRYGVDMAYTKKVQAKLEATDTNNWN